MIDKNNLINLFERLDKHLSQLSINHHSELVIYGGAALISMNILDRATVDIDVFEPDLDQVLIDAIECLGKELSLGSHWINSTGNAFKQEMPPGWQSRLETIYQGQNLLVKALGRRDLVYTKILAELDRHEDFEDVVSLAPTKNELELLKPQLLQLENTTLWKNKVSELIKLINERVNE